jgi:hypothetical protein
VQPGDRGDEDIAAVADLGALDGGVPASLLLIEPAQEQVHLPVQDLIGMGFGSPTDGASALMGFLVSHGGPP